MPAVRVEVCYLIGEDGMSSLHMDVMELRNFARQDQWYFTILLMCVQENMKRSRQTCSRGRELRAKYVLCISEHQVTALKAKTRTR